MSDLQKQAKDAFLKGNEKTAMGAGITAVIGAVLGAIIGGPAGAAIGGAIGGAAGGGAGALLDEKATEKS